MSKIDEIVKDLQELRGAEVKVFGQSTKLESDYSNTMLIDSIDWIKTFKNYEHDLSYDKWNEEDEMYDTDYAENAEDWLEAMEENGFYLKEIKLDNTCNYNGNCTNDVCFHAYELMETREIFVDVMIHRYGDVRTNYTDNCLLKFDNVGEFYEVFFDDDSYKYETIEVNGQEYELRADMWSNEIEVTECDDWNYLFTTYGYEIDDIKKEIENYLKENEEE